MWTVVEPPPRGSDPTIVIGGRLRQIGSNACVGRGEFIVVEADESDRSFLLLPATIAVITNIDAEHLDLLRALGGVPALLICTASAPVAFLTAVPILLKPSAADAVVGALARLRRP